MLVVSGYLHDAPETPTAIELHDPAPVLCAGGWGVCAALRSSGSLLIWDGSGTENELARPAGMVAGLACAALGWDFVVGADHDGGVVAWGWNGCGQVARGSWGDEAAEGMDYADRPQKWGLLAEGVKVEEIAAGEGHVLALAAGGMVWSWGCGANGQLGTGRRDNTSCPQCVLVPDASSPHGCQPCKQVACGIRHSVALLADGQVSCWGWSLYGQCGQGSTSDVLSPTIVADLGGLMVTHVGAGLGHTTACTDAGAVYVWGTNGEGQLGVEGRSAFHATLLESPVLDSEDVVKVCCGARHTVALTRSKRAYSWGWDEYGQLGAGRGAEGGVDVRRVRDAAGPITDVSAGWWHTTMLVE
ncbi:unnamed protein product [Ostreobium quekettii]|uniref:RCC1-like domain-containing protein n=1 Tax=Ostreobium quekettii TaxID=121088 RepID=A0A8S1JEN6_9CHLO|nr:unnamed protein product [Ostreobium quekettii]